MGKLQAVWFSFLFNFILTFLNYLMPKPFSSKNNSGIIKHIDRGNERVHTFHNCPEVNEIARLEFELTHYKYRSLAR